MSFEERIKRLVKEIPKGQTLTCLELAKKAGDQKAYQVVENILKNNKDSDLPYHRIVKSFKSLGKYNRDVLEKAHLLYTEGYNFPNKKILNKDFFNRDTKDIAKDLIGKWLVTKNNALIITEVEIYAGNNDLASHASKGKTQRTKVMFGPAGIWYVYLIYGMYHMLNIVTEKKGFPAAILIRGAFSVSGPGRLTKSLSIDKTFNKKPAHKKTGLWVEDRGIKIDPSSIKSLKRIGVDYAKNWKNKLFRFKYIKN